VEHLRATPRLVRLVSGSSLGGAEHGAPDRAGDKRLLSEGQGASGRLGHRLSQKKPPRTR